MTGRRIGDRTSVGAAPSAGEMWAGALFADSGPGSVAVLVTELRRERGLTQLQLAQRLCEVSGMPTVTRHEVSRWERGDRVPGPYWRGWLAAALEVPPEQLESVVMRTRAATWKRRGGSVVWLPPGSAELAADLDSAHTYDLPALAHEWLSGLPTLATAPANEDSRACGNEFHALRARLQRLRRCHDQLTGTDLLPHVNRGLRQTIAMLDDSAARRPLLRLVAGYANLAGCCHSDTGADLAARRAYRVALRAAATSGDQQFAAYVLGSLSHHLLGIGDQQQALLLARTAHAGLADNATTPVRALLLHRVALAAAAAGHPREAVQALRQATQSNKDQHHQPRPDWLYWLTHSELAAMTGRCLSLLGRPLRAIPLLASHYTTAPPRTAAVYTAWLARCHHQLGETEHAVQFTRIAISHATTTGASAVLVNQAGRFLTGRTQ